jgi:hypothetical protein
LDLQRAVAVAAVASTTSTQRQETARRVATPLTRQAIQAVRAVSAQVHATVIRVQEQPTTLRAAEAVEVAAVEPRPRLLEAAVRVACMVAAVEVAADQPPSILAQAATAQTALSSW